MGLRSGLRALRGSLHSTTLRTLHRACGREAVRLGRSLRSPSSYGRETEPRCYLLLPLEQRVIADQGLLAYFYDDLNLTNLVYTRVDTNINFDWGANSPAPGVPGQEFSAKWVGTIDVGDGGFFIFKLDADSGVRLKVDGATVVNHWRLSHTPVNGDADGDGDVDLDDQGIWASNFTGSRAPGTGGKTAATGDFDGDGDADYDDNGIWASNFTGTYAGGLIYEEGGVELSGGTHTFELEFFAESSGAQLKLEWDTTGAGESYVSIPNSRLSLPDFYAGVPGSQTATEGSTFQLSGGYFDPTGGAMSVSVDWGDGSPAQKVGLVPSQVTRAGSLNASHTYPDNGVYQATLTLDTPAGDKEVHFAVTVDNSPPTATLTAPTIVAQGRSATVGFTSIVDSSGDKAAGLHYSFGTSTGALAGTYALATNTTGSTTIPFPTAGEHKVYARIFDKDGGISQQYERTIIVTPTNPLLIGPDSVDRGRPYTLSVPTVTPDDHPITGWTIHWGDHSDPDADGTPGQTVTGTPSTLTHVYTTATPDNGVPFFLAATAHYDDGNYPYPDLAVTVRDALIVTGPDAGAVGNALTYEVDGPGETDAVWTAITNDGTAVASGLGTTFTFTPAAAVPHTVQAVTLAGDSPDAKAYSTTLDLTVTAPTQSVAITGPAFIFYGRPAVFSAKLARPVDPAKPLFYSWVVAKANGDPITFNDNPDTTPLHSGNLPTYVPPVSLDPKPYKLLLTIRDDNGGITTKTFDFEVLSDPADANYDRGYLPLEGRYGLVNAPRVVARQSTGAILVAGSTKAFMLNQSGGEVAFIARFNADLELDKDFGNDGIVTYALGGEPNQYINSIVTAMTVEPDTDEIIVAGTVNGSFPDSNIQAATGIAVARYFPDGTRDSQFSDDSDGIADGVWTKLPPRWGTWSATAHQWELDHTSYLDWSAEPHHIAIVPQDGSILVGGAQTIFWRYPNGSTDTWRRQDDFMLLKLSSDGTIDANAPGTDGFGTDGFADSVNATDAAEQWSWDYLETLNWSSPEPGQRPKLLGPDDKAVRVSRIFVRTVSGEGRILVAGTAFDFADTEEFSTTGVYNGGGMDFVLAQYRMSGKVDSNFGNGGKARTHFGTVNLVNGDNRNDWLSNISILDSGRILAVGSVPSPNPALHVSWNDTNGGSGHFAHGVLGMAWYTPSGQPDLTIGSMADGPAPTEHTGTFTTDIVIGANRTVGMAFDATNDTLVISTQGFGKGPAGSGANAGAQLNSESGWQMIQVHTNEGKYTGNSVEDEDDVRDRDFGSLGDGRVSFAKPEPFRVSPGASEHKATGPIKPVFNPSTVFVTSDGVIALGGIAFESLIYGINAMSRAMLIRYRTTNPTPTNLVATPTGQLSVSLTWQPPTTGSFYSYLIERAPVRSDGDFDLDDLKVIGYSPQGVSAYTDDDPALQPGTAYVYRVHVIDGRFDPDKPQQTMIQTFAEARASTYPDFSNYGLIESIYVLPDGTASESIATLKPGTKYLIIARGTFSAIGPDGQRYALDAEYAESFDRWHPVVNTPAGNIDVGVAVNGPGQLQFYQNVYEVPDGDRIATFTIVRTGGLAGELKYRYRTVELTGQSAPGEDPFFTPIVLAAEPATLAAGVSTATVDVHILRELTEGDRSFKLELLHPDDDVVIHSAIVEVFDKDTPPKFEVTANRTLIKPGQDIVITVTRSANMHGPASVRLSTAGTAVSTTAPGHEADGDYDGLDTVLHFGSRDLTKTIPIKTHPRHDTAQVGRWFNVLLTKIAGDPAEVGDDSEVTITFTDPAVTVPVVTLPPMASLYFREDDGYVLVPVALSTSLSQDLTIPYTIEDHSSDADPDDDLAARGTDFSGSDGTIKFKAGATTASIPLTILNDNYHEGDEYLTIKLGTPSGPGVVLARTSSDLTIIDDDPAAVLLWKQGGYPAYENSIQNVLVHRIGNRHNRTAVHVRTTSGTADDGTNYTGVNDTFTFTAGAEDLIIPVSIGTEPFAGTKTFSITLSSPSDDAVLFGQASELTIPIKIVGSLPPAAGTPALVQFEDAEFNTNDHASQVILTVHRTPGSDPSQAFDVKFKTYLSATDKAIPRTDFTPVSEDTLHFDADHNTREIRIPILKAGLPDGQRTFHVELYNPTNSVQPGPITSAVVTIHDQDPPASFEFEYIPYCLPSPDPGPIAYAYASQGHLKLKVLRHGNLTGTATVEFEIVGGNAILGTDYAAPNSYQLTFDPGDSEEWICIAVADVTARSNVTFDVLLTNPSRGLALSGYTTARVHILDAPAFTVWLEDDSYTAVEGRDAIITVKRDGNLTQAATVAWAINPGSATALIDYDSGRIDPGLQIDPRPGWDGIITGTVNFAPGRNTAQIRIPITADSRPEPNETFEVVLGQAVVADSSHAPVAIGEFDRATVTIGDNATIRIGEPSYTKTPPALEEWFRGREVPLHRTGSTIATNQPASVAWKVEYASGESEIGTASFRTDQTTSAIRIPSSRLLNANLGPVYDRIVWRTETARLTLSDPSNASLASRSYLDVQIWVPHFIPGLGGINKAVVPAYGLPAPAAAAPAAVSSVEFERSTYLVNEGAGTVALTVRRDGSNGEATINYSTSALTATAGTDFTAVTNGEITFGPGETSKTIEIQISPDSLAEANEAFKVTLTDPTDSTSLDTATVIIAPLTDPEKSPSWGEFSKQSDHTYRSVLEVEKEQHLSLNYRFGPHTDVEVNTANRLLVELHGPRPASLKQLAATPIWSPGPTPAIPAVAVRLAWQTPAEDADYYVIERSNGDNNYTFLATAATGTTSYTDITVHKDHRYNYRLTAYKGGVASNPSNIAYTLLVNHAPKVQEIPTQVIHPAAVQAPFEYQVVASDPEGTQLHYSMSAVDNNNNPVTDLTIDPATGIISATSNWPTAAHIHQTIRVKVTVQDQAGRSTDPTFSIVITSTPLTPQQAGDIVATTSPDGRSATLTTTGDPSLSYEWQLVRDSESPPATLTNSNTPQATIHFTKAGPYKVRVKVTRLSDIPSSITVPATIGATQLGARLVISPLPADEDDPYDVPGHFPDRLPTDNPPITLDHETTRWFATTMYDQFGDIYNGGQGDGVHPNVTWTLLDNTSGQPIGQSLGGNSVEMHTDGYRAGNFTLSASLFRQSAPPITATRRVNLNEHGAPRFSINYTTPIDPHASMVQWSATVLPYPGNDDDLEFHWSVIDHPEFSFANNGTPAAKITSMRFPRADVYDNLRIRLTVIDPHTGLSGFQELDLESVEFVSTPTSLLVTPAHATLPAGANVKLDATLVDQFGQPCALPPNTTICWSSTGQGNISSTSGSSTTYSAPGTPPTGNSTFLANVKATLHDFPATGTDTSVTVPLNFGLIPPPSVSLEIPTIKDPLLGDTAATRPADLVDQPQTIKAIITDPQATSITWELRAVPDTDSKDPGTLLLTGTGPAGAPGRHGPIGTLAPSQLPDGFYTLKLIVRAQQHPTSPVVTATATQHLQIRSAVKLGNLTLPVTDLTHDVPNSSPLSVSRNYDSQRAGQDNGLGFGWTLDSLQSALTTTMSDHDDQGKLVLSLNDLVYVTLPTGQRHAFAFRPVTMLKPATGPVSAVATAIANFVPVDGSAATLQASDAAGSPRIDYVQWLYTGGFQFRAVDHEGGYNPKYDGGYYLLTTVDGTRYVINASTQQLHSRIDLFGRVETFTTAPQAADRGAISTKLGSGNDERTYGVTPEWTPDSSPNDKHITSAIITVKNGNGPTTVLHKVEYGYDSAWNLTTVAIRDPNDPNAAPLRATTYSYDAHHRLKSVTDARGVKVLTADYDPKTSQLTQLTNLTGASAKTAASHTSSTPTQSVTDPSGTTKTENTYDDHGNITREIRAIFDPTGKTLQHYVVTLHEYDYGKPEVTDNYGWERRLDDQYENPWPLVNVLSYAQTSTPFIVPASHANDRLLPTDRLVARGYLKTAPGSHQILWASIQTYDTDTRTLAYTRTLREDGNYTITEYSLDKYVFGKPTKVRTSIVGAEPLITPSPTTYTYNTTTGQLRTVSDPNSPATHYLYGNDTIPGTDGPPTDAPAGALVGTYRDIYEDNTPISLTRNHYHTSTTATATTPGAVAGLLSSTTDFTADPNFGLPDVDPEDLRPHHPHGFERHLHNPHRPPQPDRLLPNPRRIHRPHPHQLRPRPRHPRPIHRHHPLPPPLRRPRLHPPPPRRHRHPHRLLPLHRLRPLRQLRRIHRLHQTPLQRRTLRTRPNPLPLPRPRLRPCQRTVSPSRSNREYFRPNRLRQCELVSLCQRKSS